MKGVIIAVRGGVAFVLNCDDGIQVTICDYDSAEVVDDQFTKTDSDGERYVEEVFTFPTESTAEHKS